MTNIKNHIVFIILFFTLVSFNSFGQSNTVRVTGQYSNIPLTQFISQLEQETDLKFYFLDKTVANKNINGNFNNTPIEECLQEVCKSIIIQFYIENNNIYLFGGQAIQKGFVSLSPLEADAIIQNPQDKSLENLRKQEFKITNIGIPGKTNLNHATLKGTVTNFDYKQPIVNGNVIVAGTSKGVSTNKKGVFEINLEKGNHSLQFSSVGMKPTQRIINIYSDGKLNVELETQITLIGDVDIFGDKQETVTQVRSGVERMDEKTINSLPALMGEPDVMKTTLMMPGVQTVGEGTQGFNVRGGKTDQNLILIDNTPLYYPSHFFGNFSAINSDMIKEAILYKGSIPSKYGGRISSVYEINTKDGNPRKISGAGGISPLSVRAMLDGPVYKLSTFAISARSTYSDYILDLIKVPDLYNSQASFNDIQAKLNLHLNDKNQLKLGYYTSNDKYKLRSDTLYKYKNAIATAKYNHRYNDRWQSDVSLSNSFFAYNISSQENIDKAYFMTHDVLNAGIKSFNEYRKNQEFSVNFGVEFNWYNVNPGVLEAPDNSTISPFESLMENAGEFGGFAGIEFPVSPRFKVEGGVRLAGFLSLDDGRRYIYAEGKPLKVDNIIDTITGNKNQIKQTYFSPEIRFSANYLLGSSSSLKFGYNRTSQFIHILTNSTAISPTDTWKLSDEYLPPQLGHQFSLGIFKSYNANQYETSVEGFYKNIENLKEYKPGATLVLNDHIETEILNGIGKSYGVEFSLKKHHGRLNGWMSYTYSRTLIRSNSEFESEQVNNGEFFPASYDKPHNLNIFANLKASRRIVLSSTLNYSTGRPITYPVAKYQLGEQVLLHYSKFNQYRIPDYFRMDFSVTFEGSLKSNKKIDSSLTFSVYNVTARKNAYSVFFRSEGEKFEGYKLSVFATAIPTLSYNFKF